MTRAAAIAGSVAAALLATGAAAAATHPRRAETGPIEVEARALTTSAPQADRDAPPDVPPVEHHGTRYEQVLDGAELGGRLAATDIASGRRLWTLDVYHVPDNEASGIDAIGRYFEAMTLSPDGKALMIEDEGGVRYSVDLASRTVTVLNPPAESDEAAKPEPNPKP